ncbi:MAG: hypothetical protein HY922_15335 [Elusimicrobia bacterium]|nr:hypothetical protein [Elusimicrobiota bacterium]
MANPALQSFVLARLADFCDVRVRKGLGAEHPIPYLLDKLREIEPPLYDLKQQLFNDAINEFFLRVEDGKVDQRALDDFVFLMERYLPPVDFVDAVFDLSLERLREPRARSRMADALRKLTVHRLLDEEALAANRRRPSWEQLARTFYSRLDFERIENIAKRRPMTRRRLNYILRRVQSNVGEFCAVLHHPRCPDDLFTPFMTPRIEALLAACRRLLNSLR